MAALKLSNEKMEDIIKIVKSLEVSGLLLKGITEIISSRDIRYIRFNFIGKYFIW